MTRLAILLALIATPAFADAFQDLDAVERQVIVTAGAPIGQENGPVAPIDRRLKLTPCPGFTVDPPAMGAVTVRCPSIGWRLRVPLVRPAAAVAQSSYPPQAKQPPVIRRGDPVSMTVDTGAFAVSVEAIAEQDGAPGDRIRVRSDPRSPPKMVEVVDAGRVRLPGFK